jgi:hypothetical protein
LLAASISNSFFFASASFNPAIPEIYSSSHFPIILMACASEKVLVFRVCSFMVAHFQQLVCESQLFCVSGLNVILGFLGVTPLWVALLLAIQGLSELRFVIHYFYLYVTQLDARISGFCA